MGTLRSLLLGKPAGLTASAGRDLTDQSVRVGIRSPWANTDLARVVWSDIYGISGAEVPVGRGDALTIPAVAKGLALVTTTLASCPLVQLEGVNAGSPDSPPTGTQPEWLFSTAGDVSPYYRLQLVVEDLVLDGWSVIDVQRDPAGDIIDAARRHPERWMFDGDGNVCDPDGHPLPLASFVLVKGPHDGILITGRRALRGALNVELAWQRWVRNPIPTLVIKATDDTERTDPEVNKLLGDVRSARQDPDGALMYVPANLDVQALGTMIEGMLTEARNASAVDVARLLLVPSTALDAGPVQTSLTYQNQDAAGGLALPLYGLSPYANAIGAALSQDSVTPRGTRIALDMTQLMATAGTISRTGTPTED